MAYLDEFKIKSFYPLSIYFADLDRMPKDFFELVEDWKETL